MCACAERPKCQHRGCDNLANRTLFRPWWPVAADRVRWICFPCLDSYDEHVTRRVPGLDKPEGAGEDWRPSLSGMFHLAFMRERDEQRRKRPPR